MTNGSLNNWSAGVGVAFEPDTYMVTEGNQREIRVVVRGNYEVPVEVLLSTSGITARGNFLSPRDAWHSVGG